MLQKKCNIEVYDSDDEAEGLWKGLESIRKGEKSKTMKTTTKESTIRMTQEEAK